MTLPEKVGQMDQQLVDNLTGPSSACGSQGWAQLNQSCMKTWLVDNNTGSLLAGGTDNPPDTTGHGGSGNTGYDWANEYNMIQQYAIQNSRLHIPLIFGVDAVHGFGHPWQAPLYPQSIGMGATWDPSAARAGGAATADAVRATGWNWVFAPVQDLARDNRWGRTYETWAEEPVLAAAMGGANIQGMQARGPAGSLGVAATVKHFAGYSQSINGHDRNEALLPLSYLQSVILPSYAGGIDAGARTVMVDSGSINGVPATGSHYLLTDILRNQMHFQGVVISDYQDVQALQTAYHVAANPAEAIAEAVNAGVDMAMYVTGPDQWQTAILQDVHSHLISMARINRGGAADSHAEVPARPVRPTVRRRPEQAVRRRQRRQRSGHRWASRDTPGGAGIDDPAAQPEQHAAALLVRQGRRHRSERRLDDEPARRVERQLARRLRCRSRLLHGSA